MITRTYNKLFTPVQVGAITLKHRIVMPPLSRLRAEWPSGVPSDLMREYYSQRASDGGLILTEATAISPSGRGYRGAPCLYRDEQVTGWKRITDAAHANGGYMFVQLWHAHIHLENIPIGRPGHQFQPFRSGCRRDRDKGGLHHAFPERERSGTAGSIA